MSRFNKIQSRLGLPLLAKELTELAARRRTFNVRVLYALLLFTFVMFILYMQFFARGASSPLIILGMGSQMLAFTVSIQAFGIYLFLPMLATGAIANEKENETFSLLLLTKLSPWTIIFEKLASRLVSMTSCILLSIPLLAFAYSLGGVNTQHIMMGVLMLFLTLIHIGSLAIFCSAYFRTMASAVIFCYLIGFANIIVWPLTCSYLSNNVGMNIPGNVYLMLFPMGIYANLSAMMTAGATTSTTFLIHVAAMLGNSAFYLLLARYFIVRRAFAMPNNQLRNMFRFADRVFDRTNKKVAGDVILVKPSLSLPQDAPIHWRETTKRSLGTFRHLIRLLLVLEAVTIVVIYWTFTQPTGWQFWYFVFSSELYWILTALIMLVESASLISIERSRQTLDTLLASPLETKQIIREKLRSLRPLMITLLIPFATFSISRCIAEHHLHGGSRKQYEVVNGFQYALFSLSTFVLYMYFISSISFYIGLRLRSRSRAVVSSLMMVSIWCSVPAFVVLGFLESHLIPWKDLGSLPLFILSSPAAFLNMMELRSLEMLNVPATISFLLNFGIYLSFTLLFRFLAYRSADKFLGRATPANRTETSSISNLNAKTMTAVST